MNCSTVMPDTMAAAIWGNGGSVLSQAAEWMGQPHSLLLTLPPLSVLIMQPEGE